MIAYIFGLLIAGVGAGACQMVHYPQPLAYSELAAVEEVEPDFVIEDRVNAVLASAALPSHKVEAEVQFAIAALDGQVLTLASKRVIVEQVLAVPGVKSVIDRIAVAPAVVPPDPHLRKLALQKLRQIPMQAEESIRMDVSRGMVVMEGKVDSWSEVQLAEYQVATIPGVLGITNRLQIRDRPLSAQQDPRDVIRERWRFDHRIPDPGKIKVVVAGNAARLTGRVDSFAAYKAAVADAWVAGIKFVDGTSLLIDQGSYSVVKMPPPDPVIEQAIERTLSLDPRVDETDIRVEVKEGVALLSGVQPHLIAAKAAREDARNTNGVVRLSDSIIVDGRNLVEDADLEAAIETALINHPVTEIGEIRVNVVYGVAYLSGFVDVPQERAMAERVASEAPGLIGVDNNILVRPAE